MNTMTETTLGFSDRVDVFLGSFDHAQIVTLSYTVSAIVLLCLFFYIVLNGKHQKARLNRLEQVSRIRAARTNSKDHGQA